MHMPGATNPAADDDQPVVDQQEGVAESEADGEEQDLDTEDGLDTDDGETEDDGSEDEADTGEADTEEVELDGVKHRIPKALKGAFLMQQDYTRKTQELADQRRTFEETSRKQAESLTVLRQDHARVAFLEERAAAFDKIDWPALREQDPDRYRDLRDQYRDTKEFLSDAKQSLTAKEQARLQEEQAEEAKALKETGETLARDIPGWGPDLAGKLVATAAEFGITTEDLRHANAPSWKVLHAFHQLKQQVAQQQKTQRHLKAQAVTPPAPVKGNAPRAGLSDKLSPEEWTRRRNAQLARRAR